MIKNFFRQLTWKDVKVGVKANFKVVFAHLLLKNQIILTEENIVFLIKFVVFRLKKSPNRMILQNYSSSTERKIMIKYVIVALIF